MESIFESSYLFDPTHADEPSPFLSFSSLAGLDSSPYDTLSSSWGAFDLKDKTQSHSNPSSDYTSSPSPPDPFQIVNAAFEPTTPAAEVGIFHTPARNGSTSKIAGLSEGQLSTVSYRSASSSDWDTPVTPSLTTKSSCDSFSSFATGTDFYLPTSSSSSVGFSWDEASSNLGSSSYTPISPTPHRIASNPVLGSARHPKAILNRASMPALKEEDNAGSLAQWFDGTETAADVLQQQQGASFDLNADTLANDLDWVFGDHGLGEIPTESTIFSAFENDQLEAVPPFNVATPSVAGPSDWQALPAPVDITLSQENSQAAEYPWLPEALTQDVDVSSVYDFTAPTAFTIDPLAVMSTNLSEDEQRPLSAPRLNGSDGSGQMLSVPTGGFMSRRSISSDGFSHPRNAPPRDLFAYTPQAIPTGPPVPQPLYTSQPAASFSNGQPSYPRAMPLTPSVSRRSSQQLSIQINPPSGYSTYMAQSPLPPTPQSASFPEPPSYNLSTGFEGLAQTVPMGRSGTQPLPMTRSNTQTIPQRRLSGTINPSSLPNSSSMSLGNMPAHLARAQAVVQMNESREEQERQEIRRQASMRRVGMAEASVMQQPHPTPSSSSSQRPQQTIMGWEGPGQPTTIPVLTSAPLVTVHPPPTTYYLSPGTVPQYHRIHPPPHPTYHPKPQTQYSNRPIANLPSPKAQMRRINSNLSSPQKTPVKNRSPSSKRKTAGNGNANGGGGFSWGETTFINFTCQDAEKLLTGVAPSGSQSKRRREEDAARAAGEENLVGEAEDRVRSKRSRSDD